MAEVTKKTTAKGKTSSVKKDVKPAEKSAAVKEAAKPEEKAAAVTEKAAVKKETKAAAAKKETVKKETVKKPAKAAAKAEVKTSVNFQFSGKTYSTEDLLKIFKDVWKYDLNRKEEDITSVELYVKPEENVTYYVANGDVTGSFAI